LSAEKGVDDLLHAMRRLPNLRLTVAGDGPERGRLQQLAAGLGLANVEFAGHLRGAELDRVIANSRFTVLPSHAYETLGKTILESYAAGRAVVASDLGSRRELVQAGTTGLLYRTGDVDQLALGTGGKNGASGTGASAAELHTGGALRSVGRFV
jgi:glycosyltransferase involved in cell wall biosynthesis